MEESIYNLIPQPVPLPEKAPMYRSKHNATCPPTYSTFGITNTSKPGYTNLAGSTTLEEGCHTYKKAFATMGKDGNAIPPSNMLKKKTGTGGGVVLQGTRSFGRDSVTGGACYLLHSSDRVASPKAGPVVLCCSHSILPRSRRMAPISAAWLHLVSEWLMCGQGRRSSSM